MSNDDPKFNAGQVFTETCLAIDINGNMWWILMDEDLSIEKAEVTEKEKE